MKPTVPLILALCLSISPISTYAGSCPPCVSTPMNVTDTGARSANGRPIITLRIDASWNTPNTNTTRPQVWNGVTGAVQEWNTATDTGDSTGHGTYYQIKFDEFTQANPNGVNIIVIKDDKLSQWPRGTDIRGAQGITGKAPGPYYIHLRPDDITIVPRPRLKKSSSMRYPTSMGFTT